ncbi:transporter, ABC superfamily [Myxozyma melibiosi]|uniref:Transporter, ABC superfamily n=1 Tax=Myxozyma melibiosi TaxID=54550 RepID=A0ABR1F2C7_9ASCO
MRSRQYDFLLLVVLFLAVARSSTAIAAFPGSRNSSFPMSSIFNHKNSPHIAASDECFNCLLPAHQCAQFADCRPYDGFCDCPAGFGGADCVDPVCGSLADGRDRMPRDGPSCDCTDGWGGINCNVCQSDDSCNAFTPDGTGGACYKGGMTVKQNFQMCNVTNRKIVDILDGDLPQVTFTCNRTSEICDFQFWIGEVESFYCQLNECEFSTESTANSNKTMYACPSIECACIPDRMLCGADGSIDITDFLTEAIEGPGYFTCDSASDSCEFSEPAMDELIQSVFGDETITLHCDSGECMHYSEIPGYELPKKKLNRKVLAFGIISVLGFIGLVTFGVMYTIRKLQDMTSGVKLPSEDESYKLMTGHTPATLLFRNTSYSVRDKTVLRGVQGVVRPGEIMAIMGASGAGKTSLLDILAHKNKDGRVDGQILVNGYKVTDDQFKGIIGFVDQEDALMPTLTVYETILNSALLRLPKTMSRDAKHLRVLETMNELGIIDIKDQVIGWEGRRGISGGEKRRVAIACELVTSPSIIFLDEPTSGLDSFNAYNVIESLKTLAQNYKRTVIFTIHQPRSNIVALFDRLLLLSHGEVVYSGLEAECQAYFAGIGYDCPPGFNLADFLIDLTMTASQASRKNGHSYHDISPPSEPISSGSSAVTAASGEDEDGELIRLSTREDTEVEHPLQQNGHSETETESAETSTTAEVSQTLDLVEIVREYKRSQISNQIISEIEQSLHASSENTDEIPSFLVDSRKIGVWEQFVILSGRTFKNLYRNPMLLLTHYGIALVLSVLVGYLYYDIVNDISGFQNRLGLFFFLLTLFGFSTLTTLHIFASERQIFVRERANGFYTPIAYFASKVVFDIIPLRVVPPLLLGLIIYPLVGLNFESYGMAKFLLVLILFNLSSAAICLFIGVMIKDSGVASLIGILVMLFSLLFAGLFLNKDSIPPSALWIQNLSIFHYAFEAMLVNEVRYLTLIEYKFGLSIEVPGATILSTFGFDTTAFRRDVTGLVVFFGTFIALAYAGMHFHLVERR